MKNIRVKCFKGFKPVIVYGIKFKGEMVYVGVTTMGLRSRIQAHFSRPFSKSVRLATSVPKLYDHIRENPSLDDYEVEVFEQCSREKSAECEKHFISKFKPRLNTTSGGNWPTGKDHYLFGRKVDSKIVAASIAARLGKPLSAEHREKIGAAQRGKAKRPELQVVRSDGKQYASVAEVAKELNVSRSAILQSIRKGVKSQGFHFRYAGQDFSPLIEVRKKLAEKKKLIRSDGKIYESLAEACLELMPENPIRARNRMNGAIKRNAKCFGYFWNYNDLEGKNGH